MRRRKRGKGWGKGGEEEERGGRQRDGMEKGVKLLGYCYLLNFTWWRQDDEPDVYSHLKIYHAHIHTYIILYTYILHTYIHT